MRVRKNRIIILVAIVLVFCAGISVATMMTLPGKGLDFQITSIRYNVEQQGDMVISVALKNNSLRWMDIDYGDDPCDVYLDSVSWNIPVLRQDSLSPGSVMKRDFYFQNVSFGEHKLYVEFDYTLTNRITAQTNEYREEMEPICIYLPEKKG